jgi:hypothetical protein
MSDSALRLLNQEYELQAKRVRYLEEKLAEAEANLETMTMKYNEAIRDLIAFTED